MATRSNQKSFYVQEDVAQAFEEFTKRYPHVRITDAVNAAFRNWLPLALKEGVDGNLNPLCLINKKDEKK